MININKIGQNQECYLIDYNYVALAYLISRFGNARINIRPIRV